MGRLLGREGRAGKGEGGRRNSEGKRDGVSSEEVREGGKGPMLTSVRVCSNTCIIQSSFPVLFLSLFFLPVYFPLIYIYTE